MVSAIYHRLLILLLLALCLLGSQPAAAKTFNAESFTLDNGLQVVVIPNHRAPVVSHMIWYKFGGAEAKPGESGVAHFLEHLMFKGTPTVPEGKYSLTIKKLGGNDNAFTTHDYTAFYADIARAHLEKIMEMEADRMKNLALTDEQVASERQVIIEERHQRVDNNPQARFQEQMMSALFVNHPYAIPVLGWLHEMRELTREEELDSYRKWYAPNNAIVIVAGDITADELKPLARKYYGSIPSQPVPERLRPRPAPIIAQHNIIMTDPRVGQPIVMKVYRAPRGSDAMALLARILGGGTTARLYKDLVVGQKLAISANADYDAISLNDTTFTIYATPTPGTSLQALETGIDKEIAKLLDTGVTLEELKSAKTRTLADFTYYRDSLQGPALLFGQALASGFDIGYIENHSDRVEKLAIEDVNAAADTVFHGPDLPVTGVLLPKPAAATAEAAHPDKKKATP
jgi:zinc protease